MTVLIILSGFYLVFMLFLLWGWHRRLSPTSDLNGTPTLEVIIPVRNDADRLLILLDDLAKQIHPPSRIIVVDDHSTDGLYAKLQQLNSPDVKYFLSKGEGKKSAITTGVFESKGEIIVTTDADCRVPSTWTATIKQQFKSPDCRLLMGAVAMESSTFLSKVQSLEFASLVGSGAAMANVNLPIFCNGANLAYRRRDFIEVDGYSGNETISSGDDEFLMRKIQNAYPLGIKFLFNPGGVVFTRPSKSVSEFISQRIRWAGKWRSNDSRLAKALAVFIFAAQVAFISALVTLFFNIDLLIVCVVILKIILEFVFLKRVVRFLNIQFSLQAFSFLQVAYPFYVLFIGVASQFVKTHWKGRVVSTK